MVACRMEETYNAVLAAQKAAIAALVPGAPLSAAFTAATETLRSKLGEDVAAKLGKSVGFAMGLELREAKLQLTGANEVAAQPQMVFNVSVGLSGLENPAADSSKGKCGLGTMHLQSVHASSMYSDWPGCGAEVRGSNFGFGQFLSGL